MPKITADIPASLLEAVKVKRDEENQSDPHPKSTIASVLRDDVANHVGPIATVNN